MLDPCQPCLGAWYDRFCLDKGEVVFPVAQPEDKEGFPLLDEGDEDQFIYRWKGDHLMSPFQCNLKTSTKETLAIVVNIRS